MRLTVEEHPAAIRRYAHLKPAPGARISPCAVLCPGTRRTCTLEKGHRGPHAAHGLFNRVLAVWDSGARGAAAARASQARARSGGAAKRPVGLPSRSPTGALEALRDISARIAASWDLIAFLVLFAVFVKFAIDVLLTLR